MMVETLSLTGESVGETHGTLESTQTHLLGTKYLKGHSPLVGSERNNGK